MDGLVAVVTGAASGIGKATAERLAADGATAVGLDVDAAEGLIKGDVTDRESVDSAIAAVVKRHGRIDVVVNCAGIGAVGSVTENGDAEWHRVFDINVVGIVRTTRAAYPYLQESPQAAIVNVGSIAGHAGLPLRAAYSASKGAVHALTLAMAADGVADGIRVNAVSPGTVDTPWIGRLLESAPHPKAARAQLEARQPLGRLGTAEEIADAIAYLASPRSGFVTGTILAIDGGMSGLRLPAQATRV